MIEVTFSYDFQPDFDEDAYKELVHKATAMMLMAEGFVEFRAHRNILGSPLVRRTSVWENLSFWAAFAQQPEFQAVSADFHRFVTNMDVQIWGASPISPETIRP